MDREEIRRAMAKTIVDAVAEAFDEGIRAGLSPDDIGYAAHLAQHVREGKLSEDEALAELKRYSRGKGYNTDDSDDPFVTMEADMDEYFDAANGMVDITEKVKQALVEGGEPGLSDAFVQVRVPRAEPAHDDKTAAVAVAAKGWFNWEGCHPNELKIVHRAIKLAAQSEGIRWVP